MAPLHSVCDVVAHPEPKCSTRGLRGSTERMRRGPGPQIPNSPAPPAITGSLPLCKPSRESQNPHLISPVTQHNSELTSSLATYSLFYNICREKAFTFISKPLWTCHWDLEFFFQKKMCTHRETVLCRTLKCSGTFQSLLASLWNLVDLCINPCSGAGL